MDSMVEIASFTVIGLVILFTISFATFYILKRKDNISDFFKSLGKDVESIDFSGLKVEGYEYYKSTYARRENKSALITPEYAGLISNFIPTYYENEKWLLHILRLFIDHRKRSKDLDDSLLYYLYCNGFRSGYNEIENEIDNKDFDSIDKCNKYISKYKRKIHVSDLSPVPTQDWTYFKLLGKHEGAMVRGLLYEQQMSSDIQTNKTEPTLRSFLWNVQDESKDELLKKIKKHFLVQRRGRNVAIFVKAMWINNYLLESEIKEEVYNAIETEVGYSFGKDRSSINKYLTAINIFKIEANATLLAKELKIQ